MKEKRPPGSTLRGPANGPACFALVSEEVGGNGAGIELVLAGGRRLRIAKGGDGPTLRSVLAALEQLLPDRWTAARAANSFITPAPV